MKPFRRAGVRVSAIALALGLPFFACDDSGTGLAPHGPPAQLVIVGGDDQVGAPGRELPEPLTVRVTDEDGVPVSNQLVNFRVTAGGGSVYAGSSLTNDDGLARERWTLGLVVGEPQVVEARAVDNATGAALLFGVFTATVEDDDPVDPDPNETPVLWLRADEIDAADGSTVSRWTDLSGHGHDATQPLAAYQPTYVQNGVGGLGAVRFREDCGINAPLSSCTHQFLEIAGIGGEFDENEATLIVVAEVSDLAYAIYGTGESTTHVACEPLHCEGWWRFQDDGHGYMGAFHSERIEKWPLNAPSSGRHLFVLRSGASYEFWIDGIAAPAQPASFATGSDHEIGSGGDVPTDGSTQAQRFFNGLVGEVLVYDRALSDAELEERTTYLAEKWGLVQDDDPVDPDPNETPVLWLRADEIDAADGSTVSRWTDLSGHGHDATQPLAAHQPTYVQNGIGGLGAVRFREDCGINAPLDSCTRQFLAIEGIGSEFHNEATLFVVATIDDESYSVYATGESHDPAVCGATYCDGHWRFLGNPWFEGNGHGYVGGFHRGRIEMWPTNTPSTGTHLFVLRSGPVYEFLIDGTGAGPMPADFATGQDHNIGAGDLPSDGSTQAQRFFNGLVGEVVVYDRAVTDDELQTMSAYLADKWGL